MTVQKTVPKKETNTRLIFGIIIDKDSKACFYMTGQVFVPVKGLGRKCGANIPLLVTLEIEHGQIKEYIEIIIDTIYMKKKDVLKLVGLSTADLRRLFMDILSNFEYIKLTKTDMHSYISQTIIIKTEDLILHCVDDDNKSVILKMNAKDEQAIGKILSKKDIEKSLKGYRFEMFVAGNIL